MLSFVSESVVYNHVLAKDIFLLRRVSSRQQTSSANPFMCEQEINIVLIPVFENIGVLFDNFRLTLSSLPINS